MISRTASRSSKTPFSPRFHHREFSAHVIDGRRFAKALAHTPENIQVGQGRFNHQDVGTFVDIECGLAQRFGSVRRIHLVGTPVAKLRRTFRCVSKRPIENRRELRRVAHDPGLAKALGIECFANRTDAAVHHVARCDHVGAGCRMGKRALRKNLDRFVVEDVKVVTVSTRYAAVTVTHIFAKTDIGNNDKIRTFL